MYVINRFKTWFVSLAFLGLAASCEQKTPSGSNQVNVNSSSAANEMEKNVSLGLDKSPMDMSYYPVEYPKLHMAKVVTEPLVARVIYSRPQKDGRIIFGNVLKYGSIWRLGANEASEIEFFKEISINNHKINKGRYIIYCIPYENKWTIVLNEDLYTWGLKIDTTKDLYKVDVPISKTNYPFEVFTMEFQKATRGINLVMEWDSVRALLPINF